MCLETGLLDPLVPVCVCMYEGGVCSETGLLDPLVHGNFSLPERREHMI